MGHSVGDAAKRSVAKSQQKVEKEVLTASRAIQEIRSLRAGNLQVMNMEYVDLLLAAYDSIKAALQQSSESIRKGTEVLQLVADQRDEYKRVYEETLAERDKLIEQNAEFKRVYEIENSMMKIDSEPAV
jgi:isocitrate lyase